MTVTINAVTTPELTDAVKQDAMKQGAMEQGAMKQGAMEQGAMEQGATEQGATKQKAVERKAKNQRSRETDRETELPSLWHNRRYYSLEAWLKNIYGYKFKKVSINAGFTCPNRDGTLGTGGCIFCSEGGSGDFALPLSKLQKLQAAEPYIAYFQAYTNTYAPPERLEEVYASALKDPFAAGISIATRPDCLGEEVLALLSSLKKQYPHRFIWVELGLQTIHEKTAAYLRRGYSLECFTGAMAALQKADIPAIVHVILGLPGETGEQTLETVRFLNRVKPFGVKLQLLHVLQGTDLYKDYEAGLFKTLTLEEYVDLLIRCIEQLDPDIVLHRVTGDGPRALLAAPLWSADKKKVLNTLHHELKLRHSYQGSRWKENRKEGAPYGSGTADSL